MNPVLRNSAAHVFVSSLAVPVPDDADAHHLFRVVRLRDGEVVTVSDGAGNWRACRAVGGVLVPDGEVHTEASVHHGALYTAIPKGDRVEWLVQKATEVGIASITFVDCERSVVRWDQSRAERQVERLRRIARESASQSRRVVLPSVTAVVPLAEVRNQPGVVVADPAGMPFATLKAQHEAVTGILVGPEGGLTAGELDGLPAVSLGSTVLRVETAAVIAGYLLCQ